MITKKYRLTERRDVARVYNRGRSFRSGALNLRLVANGLDYNRLGVVVSKKVAKTAPLRNRIRRRVYEVFRRSWSGLVPGHDLLLSVFDESVAKTPASELQSGIDELLVKSGLKQPRSLE